MINRVNNGYLIGVVKKEEGRLFSSSDVCKEVYLAENWERIQEILERLIPKLAKLDNSELNVNDDDYDDDYEDED